MMQGSTLSSGLEQKIVAITILMFNTIILFSYEHFFFHTIESKRENMYVFLFLRDTFKELTRPQVAKRIPAGKIQPLTKLFQGPQDVLR